MPDGRARSPLAARPAPGMAGVDEESGGTGDGNASVPGEKGLVSVVVTVTERPVDLSELYETYARPLREAGHRCEFVFAVGPEHRDRGEGLRDLADAGEPVTVLEAGQEMGEAWLLRLGASRAKGSVILTLPAYHRVMPGSLPSLVEAVEAGTDMAVARRAPRRDSWVNRLQTRGFHFFLRMVTGEEMSDVASGAWCMRREVLAGVPLYGDFYRFVPILARREGFTVTEVDCPQHPADRPTRIYGPGVYLRRFIDLLGIFFLVRFTYRPLRFFGLVGSGLGLGGGAVLLVILAQRLAGQPAANRPLLLVGVLLVTLAAQAIALGLIGEIIVHFHASSRGRYRLDETPDEVGR